MLPWRVLTVASVSWDIYHGNWDMCNLWNSFHIYLLANLTVKKNKCLKRMRLIFSCSQIKVFYCHIKNIYFGDMSQLYSILKHSVSVPHSPQHPTTMRPSTGKSQWTNKHLRSLRKQHYSVLAVYFDFRTKNLVDIIVPHLLRFEAWEFKNSQER